jgi:hypothetical protein
MSQPGMAPEGTLFTADLRTKVLGAITAVRAAGLTVFVSVQDEPPSGEPPSLGDIAQRSHATCVATNCSTFQK